MSGKGGIPHSPFIPLVSSTQRVTISLAISPNASVTIATCPGESLRQGKMGESSEHNFRDSHRLQHRNDGDSPDRSEAQHDR